MSHLSTLDWIPEVIYTVCGVPTTLTFTIPQADWDDWDQGVGGWDESASGVQEAFQIRRDIGRRVTLRFYESEWSAVRLWLEVVQREAQSFSFQFDASDATTKYTVRLVEPGLGDELRPSRAQHRGIYELDVRIRTAAGGSFAEQYYTNAYS